ncbi:unnamed protein product [Pneumocystis jirovecii]|uniref:Uncharacterized protein n=1 Tax=Pneumocystis jirovecii TaxID=42068 RepID=L0PFL9_PNEJI|nr:unnamed protein product [Pneumocystis jirovecii]
MISLSASLDIFDVVKLATSCLTNALGNEGNGIPYREKRTDDFEGGFIVDFVCSGRVKFWDAYL